MAGGFAFFEFSTISRALSGDRHLSSCAHHLSRALSYARHLSCVLSCDRHLSCDHHLSRALSCDRHLSCARHLSYILFSMCPYAD